MPKSHRLIHSRALTSFVVLVGLVSSGCSIASLIEKSNEQAERTVDIICTECVELYPDFPECEDLFGAPYRDDDCTIEALELDAAASRSTLNCLIDAQEDYNDCLEDNLDCENEDNWAQCTEIIESAAVTCPLLPDEVEAALIACL